MKRLICLLLALLLLTGCGGETTPTQTTAPTTEPVIETVAPTEEPTEPPTEPVPALLQNAVPWSANDEILELQLDLSERTEDIYCARMGENVVFWQIQYGYDRIEGVRFWLLEVSTGEIVQTCYQSLIDWSQIQIQNDRICICDHNGGLYTVLDDRLQVISQWEQEPDWNECFMGNGNKLYVLMGNYILERDLDTGEERKLLEGVSGLYLSTLMPEGAALCYFLSDTESWYVAYLDFGSGEVEEAPFRGKFDSCDRKGDTWLCRRFVSWHSMRIGNGEQAWDLTITDGSMSLLSQDLLLLFDGWEMKIYGLDGSFLTSCNLNEQPYYTISAPVWMEELNGFLMTMGHLQDGGSVVLFVPMGAGSGENLEMIPVDLTVTAEDEMAQLAQSAAALGEQYGIEILVGDACETDFWDHTAMVQNDPEVVKQELDRLEKILQSFPEGFFDQLYHEEYQRIRIQLVRKIVAKPHYGTGGDYDGVVYTDWDFGGYKMIIDTDGGYDALYYHELSHIIEDYVSWYCGRYVEEMYFGSGWEALNPSGFQYTYDRANYVDLTDDLYPYFMDNYGLINDREDRSRVFEYACVEGSQWLFEQKPGALEKMRFYAEAIRKAFDTTNWPEVTVWEQYLQ